MIALTVEEKTALIRLMWGIQTDEKHIKSTIEKTRFQICAVCQIHPSLACELHGCYLVRYFAYRNQRNK